MLRPCLLLFSCLSFQLPWGEQALCYMFPSKRASSAQTQGTEPTDPGHEPQELWRQTPHSFFSWLSMWYHKRERADWNRAHHLLQPVCARWWRNSGVNMVFNLSWNAQKTADWGQHKWAQWQGANLHWLQDTGGQDFWELFNLVFHKSGHLAVKITDTPYFLFLFVCHIIQECCMYFHIRLQKRKYLFSSSSILWPLFCLIDTWSSYYTYKF